MTYGTSYFITFEKACRYYADYGCDQRDVARKIAEGEISIGEPPIKAGQHRRTNTDGRYWIIETVDDRHLIDGVREQSSKG